MHYCCCGPFPGSPGDSNPWALGSGMEDRAACQVAKLLPAGKFAVLRRARRVAASAGDFLGEQDAEHLGGIPPLGLGGGQHAGR